MEAYIISGLAALLSIAVGWIQSLLWDKLKTLTQQIKEIDLDSAANSTAIAVLQNTTVNKDSMLTIAEKFSEVWAKEFEKFELRQEKTVDDLKADVHAMRKDLNSLMQIMSGKSNAK